MIHDVWCSQPSPQPDREGVLRCPVCKYVAPAPKARAQVVTGYVCRDHHSQPVKFPSGKGCPTCAAANLKTAAARKAKREATAARDTEEMERYR